MAEEVKLNATSELQIRRDKLAAEATPAAAPVAEAAPEVIDFSKVEIEPLFADYEPEMLVGKTLIAITNLPPRAMMGIESNGMLLSAVHTEEGEEKLHLLMVDNHIPAGAKLY